MKFNFVLERWEWCGGTGVMCTSSSGVGNSLELDFSVKGKSDPVKKAGVVFDLGGSSALSMISTYSTVAGQWTLMHADYPTVNGAAFTLKFPRWSGTLTYDPVVTRTDRKSGAAAVASHFSVHLAFGEA